MTPTFDRILCPVDFSPGAAVALDYALWLSDRFGSLVELLHVWEPPALVAAEMVVYVPNQRDSSLYDFGRRAAEQQLQLLESAARLRGAQRVEATLLAGDPAAGILDRISAGHYDLVVMGTHGRTGLTRFFMGSVSEKVVRHSTAPVLTVRFHPAAEEAASPNA